MDISAYESEGDAAIAAAGFPGLEYDLLQTSNTAEERAVLTDAAVGQATYRAPDGISVDDLARILRLSDLEKVGSKKKTAEIEQIDLAFAYWE